MNIAYLELLDCGIGEDGCRALADVLSQQKAPGLLTLHLDYNREVGDAGVSALVDRLFNNTALKVRLDSVPGLNPAATHNLLVVVATAPQLLQSRAGQLHQARSADRHADLRDRNPVTSGQQRGS